MSGQPSIGIVIPGYGHPRFLAEAIQSACTQECDIPYSIVVVDDGCRFTETADVVANLIDLHPGKLHYMRHPNAKLPGARNAGVRFLLQLDPNVDAIYFLDADNRIEPYSLKAFWNTLGDDPKVGWAYPDISFFGQVWNAEGFDTRETAPRYSRLLHLVGNISEAGSMVRADAFRNGVWYDETMQSGFEDWEFWISMIDAGYVGTPVHEAGFSYRRRPESMLAGSRRLEETLIAYIRQKHARLFAPRHLMALEHNDAPTFAVWCVDAGEVHLFTDPLEPHKTLKLKEFQEIVADWHTVPREVFFAEQLTVLTSEQWRQLLAHPVYLRWLFWRLRAACKGLTSVSFDTAPRLSVEGRPWGTPSLPDRFLSLSADALRALLDDRRYLQSISDLPAPAKLLVETPRQLVEGTKPEDVDSLSAAIVALGQSTVRDRHEVRHMHRRYAGPDHGKIRENLIDPLCAFEDQVPVPVAHQRPRALIAIDPATTASRVALRRIRVLVNALHAAGAELAFVQEYDQEFDDSWRRTCKWAEKITDVFPLQQRGNHEEFRMYLGRRISARLPMSSKADVSTIGRLADTFISIGSAGSLEVLGEIRGFGPKTAVWLEPCFEGALEGESFAKMLAYEHAIDFMVSDDPLLVSRLSAQGVPPGKIVDTATFFASKLVQIAGN